MSEAELKHIRLQLDSFDFVGEVSNELRALIAHQWPELLAKIKSVEQN